MGLAVVRDSRPELRLESSDAIVAFEQDLLAEFVLARSSAGIMDDTIRQDMAAIAELREWFGRPLWEMAPSDMDRFLGQHHRRLLTSSKARKAQAFAVFFEFLELRHKVDIHAAFVPAQSPWSRGRRSAIDRM